MNLSRAICLVIMATGVALFFTGMYLESGRWMTWGLLGPLGWILYYIQTELQLDSINHVKIEKVYTEDGTRTFRSISIETTLD